MNLREQPWRLTLLWCRTDICSCKLSAKVSLMLDNPFPVPSICKLNHITVCFIQISAKITCKQLIPFRESNVFLSHPRCFGPLGKFQHDIKISIRTARVCRLSFSCDYDKADRCWISKRQEHWNLHMTDLFTRRRDIASCPLAKQNHLGKFSKGKLRTSTLVNDGNFRSIADFASALCNVKMLIIFKMLRYLICLHFF